MQDLQRLLFHDTYEKKAKWFEVFRDEVWTPQLNVPLATHRDIAYRQLAKVARSGVVSVRNFFDNPTNIFTAHEMIGTISGATATKFTVHYNLFGGTIVALHTDRHRWIFDQIDSLDITGCFCLTELGYGNNAVKMETTAHYDEKTQEFVIDCPSVASQKYWITNGAVHANYALVFAQTYVKGKHQGINAFLVPIRDKNLKAYPGVQINDMGIKIGLNGVDNAALKFHSVRIPRTNMMNKYSDVNEKGDFSSDVKGIQQRFFKVTERLLSGRLCIASMMLGAIKSTIYVTVKYSQQRKGVSPNGNSETPIFDYQLQQNALIPIISRTLGLNMLHNYAKSVYEHPKGHEHDLLLTCCCDKAMMSWHADRSISLMRQRTGGQGYLGANMYGQAIAGSHAGMTAEGDNRVLMIKVVKDMLSIYMKNPEFVYGGEFIKIADKNELFCLKTVSVIFQMIEKFKLDRLINKMTTLKGNGASNYDILMFETSDEIQELALAHGEKLAILHCIDSLEKLSASKEVMRNYFLLFAWEVLLRELSLMLLEGWICPKLAGELREHYNALIKKAAKDIDVVIDSLNIPVHALQVPAAKDYIKYNSYPNYGEVVGAKL